MPTTPDVEQGNISDNEWLLRTIGPHDVVFGEVLTYGAFDLPGCSCFRSTYFDDPRDVLGFIPGDTGLAATQPSVLPRDTPFKLCGPEGEKDAGPECVYRPEVVPEEGFPGHAEIRICKHGQAYSKNWGKKKLTDAQKVFAQQVLAGAFRIVMNP